MEFVMSAREDWLSLIPIATALFLARLQHLEGSQASLILPFSPSKVQPTQEGTEIQKLSYESAKGREYLAGLPSSEDLEKTSRAPFDK
ncbi:uncharacterized protein LOC110617779 isoform X2 [Manihot esculenta]|uniref:uncharacterized protein LOC110617779 isoform X2 n=1 Tax=Manihot esculenta TaxID=3983 RepID=UPI000B5D80AC|nr:uncharacterized protein LOC110617779 isoform X2 [Manihot esculenta]